MTKGRGSNPGASNLNKHLSRREHKERGQLSSRRKLGQLEKHKDYVIRARKRHAKVKRLNELKRAAAQRNPDEFQIGMTKAVMDVASGRMKRRKAKLDAGERAKEMKHTIVHNKQNLQYLEFKAHGDRNRVKELLDDDAAAAITSHAPVNKHIVFVDDEMEFKKFNAQVHFDTTKEMLQQHPALRGTISVMRKTVLPEEILMTSHHLKSASQRRKERREMQEKLRRHNIDNEEQRKEIIEAIKTKREIKQYRFSDLVQEACETDSKANKNDKHINNNNQEEQEEHNEEVEEKDSVAQLLQWRKEEEEQQALQAARRVREITQRMQRSKSLSALAKVIRRQNRGIKTQIEQRRNSRFKPDVPRRMR